jgi:hypothetical protein
MHRIRKAAVVAATALTALLPATPADAVLEGCQAVVSIGTSGTVVTATLNGGCPWAGVHDEIDCTLVLVGPSGSVVGYSHVVGTTDGGCFTKLTTPATVGAYAAVGLVQWRTEYPPGTDAAATTA